ncbi:alpha/beta hydrolase [Luteipulveratus sp. YIM 133132]|uniref:alpha/beta hydrolase n=1 Tax=Luteipulveratus flavus TaxID=3031728 RepID=UPI0023AE8162|nr:alpha/beta hydrolase [Luteipulveratus sp. YIM 133132]MDE9365288.1 alpha/beta hydrolase [Luteipulveratus sp. YIM 133132]
MPTATVTAVRTSWPRRSVQSQILAAGLRHTVKPTLVAWSFVPSVIWPSRILDRAAEHLPAPDGSTVERVRLGECGAEWIVGPGVDVRKKDRAVLYLHGGALVTCSLATHRRLVAYVSHATDAPALNVDFRMMPQVTVEHMVADCLSGYRWLLAQGYAADRICVVGDSAGGFLAFLTAIAIRDEGLPMPAGLVGMSPLLDLGTERKEASPYNDRCDVFSVRACRGLARFTAAVDAQHEVVGPRVSPIDADLTGLPPVLIQIGSREILRSECEEMVDLLAASGVPASLQVWKGQVHVFQAAGCVLPEGRDAVREVGTFVRGLGAPHAVAS